MNKITEISQAQRDTFYMIPFITTGDNKAIQEKKRA